MTPCVLTLESVEKRFNRRTIFRSVNAEVRGPGSLAFTGRNGSGKSTLARIVAGVLSTTSGSVRLEVAGKPVPRELLHRSLGFVAPYLMLYDEFTAAENVKLLQAMRTGETPTAEEIDALFESVGLFNRRHERLGTFSSGMKQRVKYAVALIHRPPLLILDEPTANLDAEGIAFVRTVVEKQKEEGIVIVATNDADEAAWCKERVGLGER